MKSMTWTRGLFGLGMLGVILAAGTARADAPNRDPNVASHPLAGADWSPAQGAAAPATARAADARRIAMGHPASPKAAQAHSSGESMGARGGAESAGGR